MRGISQAISIILPVLYLALSFIYGLIFFTQNKKNERKISVLLVILIIVHGIGIILRGFTLGALPFSTIADAISFWAFALTCVYFMIELTVRNRSTGVFFVSLAFVMQLVSSTFYDWDPAPNPMLNNPVFTIHVVFTIMGYTAICISSLYALLYIMLNHNIKYHRFGLVYDKLPSLSILENLSIRSVQIGIVLLGLGIFLGHLRAGALLDSYLPSDPKVILTDLIWLIYLVGYGIAQQKKWRGRWMAYLSLTSFLVLILGNMAVILLLDSFHHF